VYFHDFKTLLRYIAPKRLTLLEALHTSGAMSVNALAKLLKSSYANVHEDVRVLESVGLIERDEHKFVCVTWNEVDYPQAGGIGFTITNSVKNKACHW
jgi:predicted transcriptional regulator